MSASEESILTAFKRRHRPIVTISRSPSLPTRLKPPPYPRPCPTNVVFCHRVLFFGRFEQDAIWILDGGKRPVTNIRSVTWPGLCTGRAWVCWSLRRRRLGSTDGLFVVWADFECWWEGEGVVSSVPVWQPDASLSRLVICPNQRCSQATPFDR